MFIMEQREETTKSRTTTIEHGQWTIKLFLKKQKLLSESIIVFDTWPTEPKRYTTFSTTPSEFGADQYESNATPLTCHPPVQDECVIIIAKRKALVLPIIYIAWTQGGGVAVGVRHRCQIHQTSTNVDVK